MYFTSATIVTSAILFQGFKGTATSISTVVMGFLQICSGVILLQLAKSSKDVPDTAVFKGDLDQVRTIAEQEEPESEPRADTIRGGAAILRAVSKRRTLRQVEEVEKLHNQRVEAVGDCEVVEWDGLRRRRTLQATNGSSVKSAKTLHPPLGMSRFPDDDAEAKDIESQAARLKTFRCSTHKSKRSDVTTEDLPSPLAMTALSFDYESSPTRARHLQGNLSKELDGSRSTDEHLPSTIRPVPSFQTDKASGSYRSTRTSSEFSSSATTTVLPPFDPDAGAQQQQQQHKRTFSFTRIFKPHSSLSSSSHPGPISADHDDLAGSHRLLSRGPRALTSIWSQHQHGAVPRTDESEEERCGLVQKGLSRDGV